MIKRAVLFLVCALVFQNLSAQTPNSQNSTIAGSSEPILLIAPFDKDTIDELNPIFNWSASSATTLQIGDASPSQISYKFLLVKINSGQSKESAIQENLPIFYLFPAQGNMLQYPISATELQRGNRYAWRIMKYLNGALMNQSEIWEFYIKKEIILGSLYELKSTDEGITVVAEDHKFNILFFERFEKAALKITIKDSKGAVTINYKVKNVSQKVNDDTSIKSIGKNIFQIAFDDNISKGAYDVEIVINKNETYKLKVYND